MNKFLLHLAGLAGLLAVMMLTPQRAEADFTYTGTYQWTDTLGVTHTSNITDEATVKEQMIALVKEVYTNKNIPGQKTVLDKDGTTDHQVFYRPLYYIRNLRKNGKNYTSDYFTPQGYGDDFSQSDVFDATQTNRIKNDYYEPNTDGMTALLVNIKDDCENADDYKLTDANRISADSVVYFFNRMWEKVKSIRVLQHYYNVTNSTNPGTLFNISSPLNKFFIMIKGRPNYYKTASDGTSSSPRNPEYAPFYGMYEQLSPMVEPFNPVKLNAYEKMASGEKFAVTHNCNGIIHKGHVCCMLGKTFDPLRPSVKANVLVYVPKKRFVGAADKDVEGQTDPTITFPRYNSYAHDYSPYFFMYTVDLAEPGLTKYEEATTTTDGESYPANTAAVRLTWTSSMKGVTKGTYVPEDFEVLRRVNGTGAYQPVPHSMIHLTQSGTTERTVNAQGAFDSSIIDDHTDVVTRSSDATVYIDVQENIMSDDQTIEYYVRGRYSESGLTWQPSNVQKVVISGYDINTEPAIRIGLDHLSTFTAGSMENAYTNTVHMLQHADGINADQELVRGHINASTATPTTLRLVRFVNDGALQDDGTRDFIHYKNIDGSLRDGATLISTLTIAKGTTATNGWYSYDVTNENGTTVATLYSQAGGTEDNAPLYAATTTDADGNYPADLLTVEDRFYVSVADNADNNRYTYRLFSDNLVLQNTYPEGIFSNVQYVKINSNDFQSGFKDYSRAEVDADTDYQLEPSYAELRTSLIDDNLILYSRLEKSTGERYARFERNNYRRRYRMLAHEHTFNDEPHYIGGEFPAGNASFPSTEMMQGQQGLMITYALARPGDSTIINTYGAPMRYVPIEPMVDVELQNGASSMTYDQNTKKMTLATVWTFIGHEGTSDSSERLYWRAWDNTQSHNADYTIFYNGYTPSSNAPQRRVTPTTEGVIFEGTGNDLGYSTHSVAVSLPTDSHPAEVYYRVRRYAANDYDKDGRYLVTEGFGGWGRTVSGATTGVDNVIDVDEQAPVLWYNLQGQRVLDPLPGQLYLRRQGATVTKAIVK